MITLILKNRVPVAYARNEHEAKAKIMEKLEKRPECYNSPEEWWNYTTWNVKEIYSFKNISEIFD